MKHRADIDGLRALAVVPVLGFHANFGAVPGGFIGVDVFFVISGYLIGGLILGELATGAFSLAGFYARRIRRILPALTVMLAATTIAGAFILFPPPYAAFAGSLAAAALSVSNVYFWLTADYFAAPSATLALRHTWSLAVEEQFYLLLPMLLMAGWGWFPARLRLVVALLGAASLAASIIGVHSTPSAAFYLLHARAWELLLGVLAAMTAFAGSRLIREAAALLGVALIAGSVALLSELTPFPGLTALPACLGTALVIWAGAGGSTLVGRVLSLPPLVFTGLISYSLYLWHWPIIVLYKQQTGHELFRLDKIVVIALSLAAAVISWWFIERPFRRAAYPRRLVFWAAAASIGMAVAAAGVIVATQGMAFRYPPRVARMAAYLGFAFDRQFRSGACFLTAGHGLQDLNTALCLKPDPARRNILLLGDSHAAHLYHGMAQVLPDARVLQATATGCLPTLARQASDARRCADLMGFMFNDYLPRARPDLLVLAAQWRPQDLADLQHTLDWTRAQAIPVLLVGPIVEYDVDLPLLLAHGMQQGRTDLPGKYQRQGRREIDQMLRALAARMGVGYASPYQALCGAGECLTVAADGAPLQFDYGHLTPQGSVVVARVFARQGAFGP